MNNGTAAIHIALLGFSDFERDTLGACFRLATGRSPHYELVLRLADSDFVVADADHSASLQLVVATECQAQTLFIGTRAPAGAGAWMRRPIEPTQVMRGLDALVGRAQALLQAPVQTSLQAPSAPAAPALPAHAVPAAQPSPSALLVDDSEVALRHLQTRLQPWGLVSDCAHSSGEAMQKLTQRDYEFVFLDVDLGPDSEMSGLTLCQHIKRHHSEVSALGSTVFMVSAHRTDSDRVRGALAGCDGYLGKPLQDQDLRRLLLRHGLQAPAA